jgi:hypothetical protein
LQITPLIWCCVRGFIKTDLKWSFALVHHYTFHCITTIFGGVTVCTAVKLWFKTVSFFLSWFTSCHVYSSNMILPVGLKSARSPYQCSKTILQPHLFFTVCGTWKLPISIMCLELCNRGASRWQSKTHFYGKVFL